MTSFGGRELRKTSQIAASQAEDSAVVWLDPRHAADVLPRPLITVVMVSYRTGPALDSAVDSVLTQDFPVELVVVDNGNPYGVVHELMERAEDDPRLVVRTGHGNVGFARACNLGARVARGAFLVFMNPDAELPTGGLRALCEEGMKLRRPWLLGAKLVNDDGTEQRGARRDLLTPWIAFVEAFKVYRLAPKHPAFARFNHVDQVCPEKTEPVPVISGAFMMLVAEDYWALGGMDEGYFLHVEDVDFCYRFKMAGGETYFVPDVEVKHHLSTSRANPIFIEWHKTRGFLRYFWKNFRPYYPGIFLGVVSVGIMAYFCAKAVSMAFDGLKRSLRLG